MKFVITAKPGTVELIELLQNIYEIYSDYVLKVRYLYNTFYFYFKIILFILYINIIYTN